MKPTPEQRKQLMRDGFVILRGMIPPDEITELRKSVDVIIDRAPPQGRVDLTCWVDHETASAVEFFVDDRVFEFSRQLMNAPDVVGHGMWIMCEAHTGWHRDIHPFDMAPLDGLQEDIRLNGPQYVQWNIALYDDPYFHLIPGSHLRRNNDHESRIERRNGPVPLPDMTTLDLKAGDASVYINAMLHCAKPSGDNKRRTFHFGYEGFGTTNFGHSMLPNTLGVDFVHHLSPWATERYRYFERQYAKRRDEVAQLFRVILHRDTKAFHVALDRLHPSAEGRVTTLIVLSKVVYRMYKFKDHGDNGSGNGAQIQNLAGRFTKNELKQLWNCFAVLDAKLQADEEVHEPLFQGPRTKYYLYEMPRHFDVEDFIASWR